MRVMFVDDEAQVLKGITRMLEAADVDWEVNTASSGPDALEALAQQPVDVLVSDMQMPGMDGAQLLDEVSQRHPNTVRIILSGQASKDAVYRAVAPMHQYLAKPCQADVLRETISRACALREMLDSTKINAFLGRISSLPSVPSIYQEVVDEIESEDGSVARVGEIVAQDPAMTAKILQLANSAIFGLRSTVSSPAQAASVIGLDALKSLVLSLQVFQSFDSPSISGFSMDAVVSHSLRVGGIARLIAKTEELGGEPTNESFTAGLLHDIGKLILAANAANEFELALKEARANGTPLCDVERTAFGLGHDGIGGYLLALWGLPQNIVEGVAFHHSPEQCLGSELAAPAIVCFANNLAHEGSGMPPGDDSQRYKELASSLGVADRIDVWRSAIHLEQEK